MNFPSQRLGVVRMLENAKSISTGPVLNAPGITKNLQATVDGTGAVTATVVLEGTNNQDPRDWIVLETITLSGTGHAMSGALNTDAWGYTRCRVTAITGTDATVNAHMVAL